MNMRSVWKYLPPGPILSLLLIGLVLLSARLYYRAVKIQRFLEPALAISQPRNEFTRRINLIFQKEFGKKSIKGLEVKSSSILMHKSLLFSKDDTLKASGQVVLKKIARIFLSLMKDSQARPEISLVLISAGFPSYGAKGANVAERLKVQLMVGFIQDALFRAEPELGIRYSTYFATVTKPIGPHERSTGIVEFRLVPSEFLHIRVLERLQKYAD